MFSLKVRTLYDNFTQLCYKSCRRPVSNSPYVVLFLKSIQVTLMDTKAV